MALNSVTLLHYLINVIIRMHIICVCDLLT